MIQLDEQTAKTRCHLQKGSECCAYIGMNGGGFACLKGSELQYVIEGRLNEGTMTAKGDWCSGPPDFVSVDMIWS